MKEFNALHSVKITKKAFSEIRYIVLVTLTKMKEKGKGTCKKWVVM